MSRDSVRGSRVARPLGLLTVSLFNFRPNEIPQSAVSERTNKGKEGKEKECSPKETRREWRCEMSTWLTLPPSSATHGYLICCVSFPVHLIAKFR